MKLIFCGLPLAEITAATRRTHLIGPKKGIGTWQIETKLSGQINQYSI